MAVSKASALRLASDAKREGALVFRGRLRRAEDGQLKLDDRDVPSLLDQAEGAETVIIVAPLEESSFVEIRHCGVCGREYVGEECPHCASARRRLRGE